jgi:hypothetical protein
MIKEELPRIKKQRQGKVKISDKPLLVYKMRSQIHFCVDIIQLKKKPTLIKRIIKIVLHQCF